MRRVAAVFVLLFAVLPLLHAQKKRLADEPPKRPKTSAKVMPVYPIKVHISGIHVRYYRGNFDTLYIYADATLDGKKVDLMGDVVPLPTGDFVARFRNKTHSTNVQKIGQKFEIGFPDNTYWRCTVEGYSE